MRGVGTVLVVHGDRITAAGPSRAADRSPQQRSKATTQGDEVRMVVDRTRCVGMGICAGIDPERFQVQPDGKSPAPKGNLEDDEVLEVAREAGSGI
jgi:ferredoxin